MSSYPAPSFSNSRAVFEATLEELAQVPTGRCSAAALEEHLSARGRELMRILMQETLDIFAEQDKAARAPIQSADGQMRTEARPSQRPLNTRFGTVVVRRLAMVRHGVSGGLHPLDARLNLPDGLHSFCVQRAVAWQVAQLSYEAVLNTLSHEQGIELGKRQAERIALSYAEDFVAFYLDHEPVLEEKSHLLVISADGKGIAMRPDSLREETRKKAEKKRQLKEKYLPGTKRDESHKKRMAEVAAVYAIKPYVRSPDEVMNELMREANEKRRPRPENKRVWASIEQDIASVVDEAFYEAAKRDEAYQRRWVALLDGNQTQLEAVLSCAVTYEVEVTVVVDLLHVIGYLYDASKLIHSADGAGAIEEWVNKQVRELLQGRAAAVVATIRAGAQQKGRRKKSREELKKCANYLDNHIDYLRYDEYLRDGLPIATGVIEGACRSLVKDRMDITGARWGLKGAEAVLKLRSLRASGDFDAYVTFHEQRELERNHLSCYQEGELQELRRAA